MTLADFIHTPGWQVFITVVSLLNAGFNIPQTRKVWAERQTAGLSIESYWMLLVVQISFGIHGLGLGDVFVPVSGAVAAATTALFMTGIYYRRAQEERKEDMRDR